MARLLMPVPSKYEAVWSMTVPHAAMAFEPGQIVRIRGTGKIRVLHIADATTVHYQIVAPWWFRLWRVICK